MITRIILAIIVMDSVLGNVVHSQQANNVRPSGFDIEKWSEAEQKSWVQSALDRGMPPNDADALTVLIKGNSSLVIPLIEAKIEEVLRSNAPNTSFADPSVDPRKFVSYGADLIAYVGDENALSAVSRLMRADEKRFARFVGSTLQSAYGWGTLFPTAYHGFEIGDPAVERRIAEWIEPLFSGKLSPSALERIKEMWAETMIDRYGGPPTESQWAADPIISHLKRPVAESLHGDMIRLSVDALRRRAAH